MLGKVKLGESTLGNVESTFGKIRLGDSMLGKIALGKSALGLGASRLGESALGCIAALPGPEMNPSWPRRTAAHKFGSN